MFLLSMAFIFNLTLEQTYCGNSFATYEGLQAAMVSECAARKTEFIVNE